MKKGIHDIFNNTNHTQTKQNNSSEYIPLPNNLEIDPKIQKCFIHFNIKIADSQINKLEYAL